METKDIQDLDLRAAQLNETGYCSAQGLTVRDVGGICNILGLKQSEVRIITGPQLTINKYGD